MQRGVPVTIAFAAFAISRLFSYKDDIECTVLGVICFPFPGIK